MKAYLGMYYIVYQYECPLYLVLNICDVGMSDVSNAPDEKEPKQMLNMIVELKYCTNQLIVSLRELETKLENGRVSILHHKNIMYLVLTYGEIVFLICR